MKAIIPGAIILVTIAIIAIANLRAYNSATQAIDKMEARPSNSAVGLQFIEQCQNQKQ